jgi:CHAD domain-containing protein
VKARRVKGLDPAGGLADNLERIVRVRVDELFGFMPRATEDEAALHDMRIAAKRLRYILEVAHPVLGEYAEKALDQAKELQELLGDIHDADVQVPEVVAVLDELIAGDIRSGGPVHRDEYAGLVSLVVELQTRRAERFQDFLATWEDLQRKGFRARLVYAAGERPGAAATIPGDGGHGG